MKKLYYGFYLLVLVLTGCQDIKNDMDALFNEKKARRIVVLTDFSLSIPETTINWYKEVVLSAIMPGLKVNDKFIVLPVDRAAQTSSSEIAVYNLYEADFVFSQDPPNQKKELVVRRMKKYLDTVSTKFAGLFDQAKNQRKRYAAQTDIFGGLTQATKYFEEDTDNYIIILSDMKQDTEELNLEALLKKKPDIRNIAKAPIELKKAKVFVLTGEQPGIGINDFKWLKTFWTNYFESNNSVLKNYESGGTSILEESLK